jgi:hypothetical protein
MINQLNTAYAGKMPKHNIKKDNENIFSQKNQNRAYGRRQYHLN